MVTQEGALVYMYMKRAREGSGGVIHYSTRVSRSGSHGWKWDVLKRKEDRELTAGTLDTASWLKGLSSSSA